MSRPHIGVVAPVYNEQECLAQLRARLRAVLDGLGCGYDVYLVDDGSTDGTPRILERFAREDKRWHGVFLARNFGHQAAITAGLAVAKGDVVIVMDGDLQDGPENIPAMLEQWRRGYDTVYVIRTKRKESIFHRLAYWGFYRLLNGVSQQRVPVDAGDFCLMARRVVDALNALPECGRFVRGLRAWVGFRQIGIETERNARVGGNPKYTFSKLARLATDGLLDFSWFPLRAVSVTGFIAMLAAFSYLAVIVVMYFMGSIDIVGWTTVVFLVIWFGGMILTSLGVVGEYLGRVYAEVKRRPTYIIASTTDEREQRRHAIKARSIPAAVAALSDRPFDRAEQTRARGADDRNTVASE